MSAPTLNRIQHPAWCSRQWCEPIPDGVCHRSAVTEWDTQGAQFLAAVYQDNSGAPAVCVDVTSRTAEPGVNDYAWFNLSPAELRVTAEHLLTLARLAEGVTR